MSGVSTIEEIQAGLIRYHSVQHGFVVSNEDPEGLHRVKVKIPGLIEESQWALPMTMGGGSAQRGGHIVPDEGADVFVWFLGGDVERPVYSGGHWGKPSAGSEMPTDALDATSDAHKVQTLEMGNLRITFDERDDRKLFSLEDKASGDSIVWDMKNAGMRIELTAALLIKVFGKFDVQAAEISLNGRNVLADSKHI